MLLAASRSSVGSRQPYDIPVFHDDQHGTAIVVMAALKNAARLVGKRWDDLRVVISGPVPPGPPSPGFSSRAAWVTMLVADSKGIVVASRDDLNGAKTELAGRTNASSFSGSVAEAMVGADVFIGVSGGTIPESAVAQLGRDAIISRWPIRIPRSIPTWRPKYAAIVATGRSDFPEPDQQCAGLPGVFRGR